MPDPVVAGTTIVSAVSAAGNLAVAGFNAIRSEQARSLGANKTNTAKDGNENLEPVEKRWPVDIKDFESLQEPFEKVLKALKNDEVKVICIHGMMGVGKTTVMERVNDEKKVAKKFDIVIWLNVSTETEGRNKSREQLQQDIVRRLNLNIEVAQNFEEVSHIIERKLARMNYLLLLDDVKQDLRLDEIGIPRGGRTGGKIVLTSWSCLHGPWFRDASSTTDKMIEMKEMSKPEEEWNMFKSVLKSPELLRIREKNTLARALCKECLGIPLLIALKANVFRKYHKLLGHNRIEWTRKERQGIDEIFDKIKNCYNHLDDAQKKCFLYCALYPVDSEIDSDILLKSWVAEDFLSDYHDVQAQDDSAGNENQLKLLYAEEVLIDLKDSSWLGGRNGTYTTMHRILRRAALRFCSDDKSNFMSLVSKDNKVSPEDWEKWSEKKYISLTSGVDNLPRNPNCSNLSTLFLQENERLNEIPGSFFDGMQGLRVLHLSGTGIRSLPSFRLNMIKVICLCNCKDLSTLPWAIGELVQLDVLDIRGTNIPADDFDYLNASNGERLKR